MKKINARLIESRKYENLIANHDPGDAFTRNVDASSYLAWHPKDWEKKILIKLEMNEDIVKLRIKIGLPKGFYTPLAKAKRRR